jgi:hypothetical protein
MLAFTMQFSSYGRKTQLPRRIHAAQAGPVTSTLILHCLEEIALPGAAKLEYSASKRLTAASSGPNSVLGALSVACPRSVAPVKEDVLTGQSQESEPNNQCSTRKHGRPVTHSVTRGAGAP